MIEIEEDNTYLSWKNELKEMRVEEMIKELKRVIPEQGIFKRRISYILSGHVVDILDRRYKSMESQAYVVFPFTNNGFEVVRFDVRQKKVTISDSNLFDIIKDIAEKYGYKKIIKSYQI